MAATGTPTPNIGLRRAQGTDPASVDDINYNSLLLDTKLGAVGNDSVQDQIDALNSKLMKELYASGDFTSATTLTDTGVSVTVPANSVFVVTATSNYVTVAPTMIAIVKNNGSAAAADVYSERNSDMNKATCTMAGSTGNDSVVLHVFCKCGTAGRTNPVAISGFYGPKIA